MIVRGPIVCIDSVDAGCCYTISLLKLVS